MVSNAVINLFDPLPEIALSTVSQYFVELETNLVSEKKFPQIVFYMVLTHHAHIHLMLHLLIYFILLTSSDVFLIKRI
jgi:hypothetical protein